MFVKFYSKGQSGQESPIWVEIGAIKWITPAKIAGELMDNGGNPIPKEGAAINLGSGGMIVVIENVEKVLGTLGSKKEWCSDLVGEEKDGK